MKILVVLGFAAGLLVGATASASELALGSAEIANLGIEFEVPEPADTAATIEARARVVVPPAADYVMASPLPGLVERVHARTGDEVSAGQALIELRSREFLTMQQEYLEAMHAARLAGAALERDEQLAAEGIIARRRLEESRAMAGAAAGRLTEHGELLRIAGMRDADIDRLRNQNRFVETLLVRAPVDGVVLDVMATGGQSVESVSALCRIANLDTLWLDIRVPRERVGAVVPGAAVAVRESLVQRPARVEAIGRAVDPETQTVSVRAELTGVGHGLGPGQLVTVTVMESGLAGSGGAALSIPAAALVRSGDDARVFVRSARGLVPVPVTVVAAAGGRVIVRGLDADAEVAVTGVSALKALWLASAEAAS